MLKDVQDFFLALSKHWGPLATGVTALVVSAVVGAWWGDHAPLWVWLTIIITSIFISCFLAWRTIKRENENYKKELTFLNTPAVSMKLHKIEDERILDGHTQILYLEVTGIGADYVRPEVFAVAVEETTKRVGKRVEISPNRPLHPFGVRRDETHNVPVISFDPTLIIPFRVLLPCKKITSDDILQSDVFKIKVCAYAGPKAAELNFEFGMEGASLWARADGADEKLYSNYYNIMRRA